MVRKAACLGAGTSPTRALTIVKAAGPLILRTATPAGNAPEAKAKIVWE